MPTMEVAAAPPSTPLLLLLFPFSSCSVGRERTDYRFPFFRVGGFESVRLHANRTQCIDIADRTYKLSGRSVHCTESGATGHTSLLVEGEKKAQTLFFRSRSVRPLLLSLFLSACLLPFPSSTPRLPFTIYTSHASDLLPPPSHTHNTQINCSGTDDFSAVCVHVVDDVTSASCKRLPTRCSHNG